PALTAAGRPWGRLGLVILGSLALIALMMASDHCRIIVYRLFAVQIAAIPFFALRPGPESRRIPASLGLCFAARVFWARFGQAGSSLSLVADRRTDKRPCGREFPSAWWQSVAAARVMTLPAVVAWVWIKLGRRQPPGPTKCALGLLFAP